MTRSQFLALFTTPFIARLLSKEEKHVFNQKLIKQRLNYLRKYPLTQEECFYLLDPTRKRTIKFKWVDESKTFVEVVDQ